MAFADWTYSETGMEQCYGELDGSIKYAGNSSYKTHVYAAGSPNTPSDTYLTHDTFLESQVQVILWCRYATSASSTIHMYVKHTSFNDMECVLTAYDTWEKHRVTFWYDANTNTKWGRDERWTGSTWEQVGGDTNYGSGSPAAGSIVLHAYVKSDALPAASANFWFDELEVSA